MKLLFVILASLSIFLFPQFADATLYNFNITEIIPSWTTITNAIVLDTNKDGILDTAYSASTVSSNTITFTKAFGTGASSIVKTFSGTYSSPNALFGVHDNQTITVSFSGNGVNCIPYIHFLNIISGSVNTLTFTQNQDPDPCFISEPSFKGTDNRFISYMYYAPSPASNQCIYYIMANTTTLTSTSVNDNCSGGGGSGSIATPFGGDPSWNTNVYLYDGTTHASSSLNGYSGYVYNTTGTNVIVQLNLNSTSARFYDHNATHYQYGMKIENLKNSFVTQATQTWNNYLGDEIDTSISSSEKMLYLNYKILRPTLTTDPTVVPIKISGSNYLGYLDLTSKSLFYTPLIDLSSYAFQSYMLDTYPSAIVTNPASTALPTTSLRITTPSTVYNFNNHGISGIVSGYKFSPQNIDRIFNPEFENSLNVLPVSINPLVGNTAVSVELKNFPDDYIVKIENPLATALGNNLRWGDKEPTADNVFTIDLPTNHCFEVFVADGTFITPTWESLGDLCASGTMPKTLIYSANLSFTFWSLLYGVSHTYDTDDDTLVTKVRHDTLPFSYTVKIFDSTGIQQYTQLFTENSTNMDIQSINASGISLPALLRVYDVDSNQLYYSTLGNAGYLSESVAWFNEWLTIEEFNLLFMLPLVFGAMFTRNTVGIGTMSTVMLIATLSWFGIIPIPDVAIYLMIFVSVVGVIAYKKLYD